jgi:hypothetical protein
MTVTAPHPFERSGLGLAPFKFVGMTEEVGPIRTQIAPGVTAEVGAPGQPMGTCKYCGQGIRYACHILSADGKRFTVGSDCVAKLSLESNRDSALISAVDKAVRERKNELARTRKEAKRRAEWTRDCAVRDAARAVLAANPTALADIADPNGRWGSTMRSYAEFCLAQGGANSWHRIARELRAIGLAVEVSS